MKSPEGDSDGGSSACTVQQQRRIVQSISFPLRLGGVFIAFLTMVFVCEIIVRSVKMFYKEPKEQLGAYTVLALASGAALWFSHHLTRFVGGGGTLHGSMAYAYSTLVLVINMWNMIDRLIVVMMPEKHVFASWLLGAITFVTLNTVYSYYTRHNALLDIASCATSLGLMDPEDGAIEPLLARVLIPQYYTGNDPTKGDGGMSDLSDIEKPTENAEKPRGAP